MFHAGFDIVAGGYIGVDVFFVISGYLITSIILVEKMESRFSLSRFFERRMRRILPGLYLVCLISTPVAWMVLSPYEFRDYSQTLTSVPLFVSNMWIWFKTGYFSTSTELKPLLHTWSLGVEEQFYLLYPICLGVVFRWYRHRIAWAFVCGIIASLSITCWGIVNAPSAAFFFLPTRVWQLLLGGLIGWWHINYGHPNWGSKFAETVSVVGLMFIGIPIFFEPYLPWHPFSASVIASVGGAAIISFSSPATIVGRGLSKKLIVGIGLISYGIYLWHQPILAFARHLYGTDLTVAAISLLLAASILMGYLTWRLVERPIRQNVRLTQKQTYFLVGFVGLVILSLGVLGSTTDFHRKFYRGQLTVEQQRTFDQLSDAIATMGQIRQSGASSCSWLKEEVNQKALVQINECYEEFGKGVLILGDSHGIDLYNALLSTGKIPFLIAIAKAGCRPDTRMQHCPFAEVHKLISDYSGFFLGVLYTQSGATFFRDSHTSHLQTKAIEDTYSYLSKIGVKTKVYWLGPQPQLTRDIRSFDLFAPSIDVNYDVRFNSLDTYLTEFMSRKSDTSVSYLSKFQLLTFRNEDFLIDGRVTYSNRDHWSSYGEEIFGSRMVDKLTSLFYSSHNSSN